MRLDMNLKKLKNYLRFGYWNKIDLINVDLDEKLLVHLTQLQKIL